VQRDLAGRFAECHVEVLNAGATSDSLPADFMASGLGSKIQTSGIDRSSKRDPIHLPWLAPTSITNAGDVLKLMGKIENRDLLMARSYEENMLQAKDGLRREPRPSWPG